MSGTSECYLHLQGCVFIVNQKALLQSLHRRKFCSKKCLRSVSATPLSLGEAHPLMKFNSAFLKQWYLSFINIFIFFLKIKRRFLLFSTGHEGVTGFKITLPQYTTRKLDKICDRIVFKHWHSTELWSICLLSNAMPADYCNYYAIIITLLHFFPALNICWLIGLTGT